MSITPARLRSTGVAAVAAGVIFIGVQIGDPTLTSPAPPRANGRAQLI